MTTRLAVLASGGGSNLQAILDYLAATEPAGGIRVSLVASDHDDAGALRRADVHGIPRKVLDREHRGPRLLSILESHHIEYIALAGYLRLVPNAVTSAYRGRIVNIHPALLPAFGGQGMYGVRVHEAVLASGARVSGATVHFVNDEYDRGPIVAQWPVPVGVGDSTAELAARVLRVEHALYPRVVRALADGRVYLGNDGRAHGWNEPETARLFSLAVDDSLLEQSIDGCLAVRSRT